MKHYGIFALWTVKWLLVQEIKVILERAKPSKTKMFPFDRMSVKMMPLHAALGNKSQFVKPYEIY